MCTRLISIIYFWYACALCKGKGNLFYLSYYHACMYNVYIYSVSDSFLFIYFIRGQNCTYYIYYLGSIPLCFFGYICVEPFYHLTFLELLFPCCPFMLTIVFYFVNI
jgi:hypothetical protein